MNSRVVRCLFLVADFAFASNLPATSTYQPLVCVPPPSALKHCTRAAALYQVKVSPRGKVKAVELTSVSTAELESYARCFASNWARVGYFAKPRTPGTHEVFVHFELGDCAV